MNKKFAYWFVLFVNDLKRDWKIIIFWVLGLGLYASMLVPAYEDLTKGNTLAGVFEVMQNPAITALAGPTSVKEAANYTLGAAYTHKMLLFSGILAMVLSILYVVRHTRKEEEQGITELLRSYQIGRQANALAIIVETALINLLLAMVIGRVLAGFHAPTMSITGSFLFGFSIGVAGMIGAVIALLMAQVMPTSSGAIGTSLGIVGGLYLLRAWTDVSNASLSIFNPLGWTYLTYPFTTNNWLPLAFAGCFCVVMIISAFILEGRRDLNSGYLPEKKGRSTAHKSFLSVGGFLIEINKRIIISWFVAFIAMGATYGSIYGNMQTFIKSNQLAQQLFAATGVSIEVSFTSSVIQVLNFLVAILSIVIMNKLFFAESHLYLNQVFATKVSRFRLYWTTVSLAFITSVVGIFLASGSLGAVAIYALHEHSSLSFSSFLASGYNLLPAILFIIGLSSWTIGWLPKLGKIVYVYLGCAFMLDYFSDLLHLPKWLTKLAIQTWLPSMPADQFHLATFSVITLLSLLLMVVGYVGYRRRDLLETDY